MAMARAQRACLRLARDARQKERRRLRDRAHPARGGGRAPHRPPGRRQGRRRSGVGARITPRSDEPQLRRIPREAADRSPHPRHAIGTQPVDRRRDRGGGPERAPRREREQVDGARRCDRRAQRRTYAAGGRDPAPIDSSGTRSRVRRTARSGQAGRSLDRSGCRCAGRPPHDRGRRSRARTSPGAGPRALGRGARDVHGSPGSRRGHAPARERTRWCSPAATKVFLTC